MKKKFILYIIILLIVANAAFYFSTISFERKKLDNYVKTEELELENYLEREAEEYIRGFYSGNNVFFTHDKPMFETDIQSINMITKTRKSWSSGELQYIIKDTTFDNIYFVDSDGDIKYSSNEASEEKSIENIFGSIGKKVIEKNLSNGELVNAEIIPHSSTGKLVLMSFFKPKYSSYTVFTEVDYMGYLQKYYSQEFKSTSLLRNVFDYGTAEYLEDIDIFYKSGKMWSMLKQGISLDGMLTDKELENLNNKGLYKKETNYDNSFFRINPEKYKFTKLKIIDIKEKELDFSVIIKISYDFKEKVEYINNSLNRVWKLGLLIVVISIAISSILFKLIIEKKLDVLIAVLNKIKSGEYKVKDIKLTGKDELTDIAETVNKLKKEVLVREKKLIRVAITDELTKLYNRKYLFHRLNEEQDKADRYGSFFSIVLLDIDFFKKINDTYGHQVGDDVLSAMGKLLIKQLRKSDIAARYGGEEFMLVLPQTNIDSAYKMVERLRETLETTSWGIDGLKVTISSGIREYNTKRDLDTFIAEVDDLLYKAKENGRNRTEI